MIKCKTCGKMVSESNSTCSYCGDKIIKLICPKCGCTDIGVDVKVGSDVDTGFFFIGLLPKLLINHFSNKSSSKYVCRKCGKRFKIKD